MQATTLGHYRLDDAIGRGGMGEVYRAFDTKLNRPVAVKVLRESSAERQRSVLRFLREARAASALNHPNIVTIHDVGETPSGSHYIVQELVEGRTLRSLLDEPMALARAIDIGRQVARALAAAHAAGIVHRDVKPENVMVRADGYVKVLDFGLARVADPAGGSHSTHTNQDTAPDTLLGTTAYMSPEAAGASTAGPPADVFALGIVLYEMAAGRRPVAAATSLGRLAAIVSEHPVPLARLNAAIPYAFDDLVLRMLAKEPERRPTAGEVVDLLTEMQSGGSTSAPAARSTAAPRKSVGREAERSALRRAYAQ